MTNPKTTEYREDLEAECHRIHPEEKIVFLPGDKVYDRRDHAKILYRIKSRTAYLDSELLLMQNVETRAEQYVIAKDLVPFLEMVTPCLYPTKP